MADKMTSAPLFGDPTVEEIDAIKKHMEDFAERLVKKPLKARQLLRETGALAVSDAGDTELA